MNILQITPGAGGMYCGNCLRDNAAVAGMRAMGHQVLMVPLYLPLTLDEPDESAGVPIFFGGISVYLDQNLPLFRRAPAWAHRLLASRRLLKWVGSRAAGTRPSELGEITLSMLRGEAGNQARELDELIGWLKTQPAPDVICLSNGLLIGMARRLKQELRAPVVCFLQGEDTFLDALPDSHRDLCWRTVAERAGEVAGLIAPSRYYGQLMARRLGFGPEKVSVVHNGIKLDGYDTIPPHAAAPAQGNGPVLGYLARACREKGLDTLVDAFIEVRKRGKAGPARLRISGSCGPSDQRFLDGLLQRLEAHSLRPDVDHLPNVSRTDKIGILKSFTVFSVPARYGEAFGLYVLEALAAGVPVVLPRTAAFPELVEETGGGVLCEPEDPRGLAEAIEQLLLEPQRARALGDAGRKAVRERFSLEAMTRNTLAMFEQVR